MKFSNSTINLFVCYCLVVGRISNSGNVVMHKTILEWNSYDLTEEGDAKFEFGYRVPFYQMITLE